uniref:Uncharacterized protein n=1 Tax=Candidatus Kentrum sp. TC TaxID=2126339 RepID=A0A450ZQ52_9GAMM|nr:MAG: hypothetical protein BECKTC1821F_GA0114240_100848 [Candidatus Kentron sp. TC]
MIGTDKKMARIENLARFRLGLSMRDWVLVKPNCSLRYATSFQYDISQQRFIFPFVREHIQESASLCTGRKLSTIILTEPRKIPFTTFLCGDPQFDLLLVAEGEP